jgi:hypothetical protein
MVFWLFFFFTFYWIINLFKFLQLYRK